MQEVRGSSPLAPPQFKEIIRNPEPIVQESCTAASTATAAARCTQAVRIGLCRPAEVAGNGLLKPEAGLSWDSMRQPCEFTLRPDGSESAGTAIQSVGVAEPRGSP